MPPLQPAGAALESLEAAGRHVALLVAEIESLRQDAERYRWLRDKLPWTLISADGVTRLFATFPVQIEASTDDKNELDSAIDAATQKDLTP